MDKLMFELKNENIGVRVTKAQKSQLFARAEQAGMTLSDFMLTVVSGYDELVEQVDSLRAELDAERQEYAQRRTALDRATELAGKVTDEKVEAARRQAVAEYRQELMASATEGEAQPETVAVLQQRLSQYETTSLQALFEQVEGQETDIVENGQPVTVTLSGLPDLVRVLVASFAIAQPQTTETDA